jgi:mannose-6-phosphate isomerase-like protein (cupin superfamily)
MASGMPSVIDLDAELAKLTMFRRTPHSTREETNGSVARLASYRDGLLLALKSAGTDHWERYLTGDELVHVLDGSTTLEIVCDDGPPKSFTLGVGMIAVIPQGAWHRSHSEGNTHLGLTPFPGEHVERDVDDPRREHKPEGETEKRAPAVVDLNGGRQADDAPRPDPAIDDGRSTGERRSTSVLP